MIIGNLKAELVLDGHDDFDVIQRVQAEVVDEVRVQGQLKSRTNGENLNSEWRLRTEYRKSRFYWFYRILSTESHYLGIFVTLLLSILS